MDQLIAWIKNNVQYKDYISCICFGHIQQKLQSVKRNCLAHNLSEWLKKRYTLENIVSK